MLPWQLVVCDCGEWAGGDATNALATAGVGNETRTARARKNCKTEGRIREKMHVENRKRMTGEPVLRELAVGGECTVLNLYAITI